MARSRFPSAVVACPAVAGFVIAAAIWWIYFDAFDEHAISNAIEGGRSTQLRSFLYGYGHLVIYAAIAAVGVGVHLAIEAAAHGDEPVPLLAGALALLIFGFFPDGLGLPGRWEWVIVGAELAVAAIGILTLLLGTVVTAVAITALAWAALVVFEAVLRRHLEAVSA